MNTTQQLEVLNLEEFRAKVTRAAREPLLARIAELEAQLSATPAATQLATLQAGLQAGLQAAAPRRGGDRKGSARQ